MNPQIANAVSELARQIEILKAALDLQNKASACTFVYQGDLDYYRADNGRHKVWLELPGEVGVNFLERLTSDSIDVCVVRSHDGPEGVTFSFGEVRITVEFLKGVEDGKSGPAHA